MGWWMGRFFFLLWCKNTLFPHWPVGVGGCGGVGLQLVVRVRGFCCVLCGGDCPIVEAAFFVEWKTLEMEEDQGSFLSIVVVGLNAYINNRFVDVTNITSSPSFVFFDENLLLSS